MGIFIPGIRDFSNLEIFIPGIGDYLGILIPGIWDFQKSGDFIPGDLGISKIWGFIFLEIRDFRKSWDFYPGDSDFLSLEFLPNHGDWGFSPGLCGDWDFFVGRDFPPFY